MQRKKIIEVKNVSKGDSRRREIALASDSGRPGGIRNGRSNLVTEPTADSLIAGLYGVDEEHSAGFVHGFMNDNLREATQIVSDWENGELA